MDNQIELEQLLTKIRESNIFELRDIARSYDIVPANIKRVDLEKEIVDVFLGNKVPKPRKKKGRPSAKTGNVVCDMLEQSSILSEDDIDDISSRDIKDFTAVGVLEVYKEGYGFLRVSEGEHGDVYVPPAQIKRFSLQAGDVVSGSARFFPPKTTPSLIYVLSINDMSTSDNSRRVAFDSLVACNSDSRIRLESDGCDYSLRMVDLVAPIGKGQRGLIVSPPKAGKTILLKRIAQSIRANYPDINLSVVLIDERPEEVTDFQESVDCQVTFSTFDQTPQHHIKVAELAIANAKRRVEVGQDVVILLDSITRLARAYNQVATGSGRTLSGGLDISALQEPKKLFGAGRNIKGGGSITVLATALIDTGSKMDDIIYEEFKGTGNMELHLDRRLSERRVFPAIDLNRSGTRREDLLLDSAEQDAAFNIRRVLSSGDSVKATEKLIELITMTGSNKEFMDTLKVIINKGKK